MRRYFGRGSRLVSRVSAAISLTSSAVLAEGVAGEAPDLDVLAHGRDRVGDELADRLLRVAERLLEQHRARFGVPLLEAAFDDLCPHVLGLARHVRRVEELGL